MKLTNLKRIYTICIALFVITACSNNDNTTTHTISIDIKNATDNSYCYLYGFLGDNQILVDSLHISDSKATYVISQTCNSGVYRIMFPDNQFFDFIYNNENIEIEIDTKNIAKSISVKESEENKILISFLLEFQSFKEMVLKEQHTLHTKVKVNRKQASIEINKKITKNYISLFDKTLQKITNKDLLAYSIIKSMYVIDYDQYSLLHPNDSISETDYYVTKYFKNYEIQDSRLLASPFLFIVIQKYLQAIKDIETNKLPLVFKPLLGITKQHDIKQFIYTYTYEYLYKTRNIVALQAYMQSSYTDDACIVIQNTDTNFFKNSFKGLNTKIEDIPKVTFDFSSYTTLLFSDTTCNFHKGIERLVKEKNKVLVQKKIQPYIFTPQNSPLYDSLLQAYNIGILPTMIIVNSEGKVQGRFYGKKQCTESIQQLLVN